MSNDQDITAAYAAGFFDGEGWVGLTLTNKKSSYYLRIAVANTVRAPLEFLLETWGGAIYVYPRKGNRKQQFMWYLTGRKSIPFLKAVLPYLRVKRRQAELAIEIDKVRQAGGYYSYTDTEWEAQDAI